MLQGKEGIQRLQGKESIQRLQGKGDVQKLQGAVFGETAGYVYVARLQAAGEGCGDGGCADATGPRGCVAKAQGTGDKRRLQW